MNSSDFDIESVPDFVPQVLPEYFVKVKKNLMITTKFDNYDVPEPTKYTANTITDAEAAQVASTVLDPSVPYRSRASILLEKVLTH